MRIDFDAIVSVPSRGLHFSNAYQVAREAFRGGKFPSPHGDCISQMSIQEFVQ